MVGDWDGHRWDGSHRFQCKMNSSHQNPTTYKIWSYSTKLPIRVPIVFHNYSEDTKSINRVRAITFMPVYSFGLEFWKVYISTPAWKNLKTNLPSGSSRCSKTRLVHWFFGGWVLLENVFRLAMR